MAEGSEISAMTPMSPARKTVVIILTIIFVAFWAAALVTHHKLEGSAFSGRVREGKYLLMIKKEYHETTRQRFEAIRHREQIVFIYLAAAGASWLTAAFLSRHRRALPR